MFNFMQSLQDTMLSTFTMVEAYPVLALLVLFAACALCATLLPLSSEILVFGYALHQPHLAVWIVLIATAGNTLGGMINYWIGLGLGKTLRTKLKSRIKGRIYVPNPRTLGWFNAHGAKLLFFSFLPVVGDPMTLAAGWLRLSWLPCLLWQMAGKFLRYAVGVYWVLAYGL